MMTPVWREGLPAFWTTGLAKLLVGDQPCHLEAWVKAHYQLEKREQSASLVKYKMDHTAMLTDEVDRLKADDWKVLKERFFKLVGKTAILSGKPDIIAQRSGDRPKIVDTKSGEPKDSDVAQVCAYCIAIPLAWASPDMIFEGEVVYPTHRVKVAAHEVGPMREKLFPLLKTLASSTRPDPSPSEGACRFCDVPDELCGSRFQGKTSDVLVSEF